MPLLGGWLCFNLETFLKMKAGKKSWGMKDNGVWKLVWICHCGSEWLFLRTRRGCSSQARNEFWTASNSWEEYGFSKTILRQRKCWVWGFMLQNNTFFFNNSWTPTGTQQRMIIAAESYILHNLTVMQHNYQHEVETAFFKHGNMALVTCRVAVKPANSFQDGINNYYLMFSMCSATHLTLFAYQLL